MNLLSRIHQINRVICSVYFVFSDLIKHIKVDGAIKIHLPQNRCCYLINTIDQLQHISHKVTGYHIDATKQSLMMPTIQQTFSVK
jgi:hypothetical protein